MCEPFSNMNPVQHLVHEWEHGAMSRREFFERALKLFGTAAAAEALLAACSPAPAATAVPAATATTAPAAAPTSAPTTAPTIGSTAAAPTAAPTAAATRAATAAGAPPTAVPVTPPAQSSIPGFVDPSAVDTTTVTFQNGDVKVSAYQAKPKTGGPWPAVIVIHENRGLTDHIIDVTRRVANLGYVALGVDYLSRSGGTGKFAPPADPTQAINALKQTDINSDTVAAVAYLKSQSFVKPKIGIMGFCWGGGNALQGIMSSKDIIACFSFYGPVPNDLTPVANINGSIMGSYGALDTFVNPGIPKLEAAMKSAGKTYTYKIYEGANHAFFNDTGPRFNEAAAKDSWTRLVAYFKETLAA